MTDEVRLDKWLWAARFYKTRQIAKAAIEGGKVHYNGLRSKVGKKVDIGARLTIRQGSQEKTVIVEGLSARRGPAKEAQMLYKETVESIQKREQAAKLRKLESASVPNPHKPSKKARRKIIAFKQQG